MTRLAVLADIHGNLPALEAVLDDIEQQHVDHIVVAGDSISWGPFSVEVLEHIKTGGWATLRGNNEYYLLDYGTERAPAQWQNYRIIPWMQRQLDGYWRNVIAAWPDMLSLRYPDAPLLCVCHGSPRDPWESIYPDITAHEIEEMLDGVNETTLIAAHTHLSMDRQIAGRHILNPGSVGFPADGNIAASYMILNGTPEGWQAELRRIPYDMTPLWAEYERKNFAAQVGPITELVYVELRTARLQVYPFSLWRAEQHTSVAENQAAVALFNDKIRRAYTPEQYLRLERVQP